METKSHDLENVNVRDNEFNHLNAKAKIMLGWEDKDRIRHIEKRDPWINYQAAQEILDELTDMLRPTDKIRVPGMVLTAQPHNGKSRLVRKFASEHLVLEREDGTGIDVPVLLIDGPPKADVAWLLGEILVNLNAPYQNKQRPEDRFRQIINLFKRVNVKMLIVDEISDIVQGSAIKQREFLTLIKQMATRAKIPIILTGVPRILSAISIDDQTSSRFYDRKLPDWKQNRDFIKLLMAYEKNTPLRKPSNFGKLENQELALKILAKADGRIGYTIDILDKAAVMAIKTGEERITLEIIDSVELHKIVRKNDDDDDD